MEELLAKINIQVEKFQKNASLRVHDTNKAAGARSRKASLELTQLFKEWRKLSVKN